MADNNITDITQSGGLWDSLKQHLNTDVQTPWAWRPDQSSYDAFGSEVNHQLSSFSAQFQNLVGRAPTSDEQSAFVNQYVIPNTNNLTNAGSAQRQNTSQYVNDYINTYNQGAAKDYATQQLTSQQGEANRLGDLFQSQGKSAINDTEQTLLDYQSKLFDKLRPNLITSLQAQGLLNTGGMNEAFAGKAKDLADSAGSYLADANLQNDQQANAIRFGGASAPYQYQQGNILSSVPYLQQMGQQASTNGFNTFMSNLDYSHQLGLIGAQTNAQRGLQPSFLRTFGQSAANSFGNNFSIPSYLGSSSSSASASGATSKAGLASLL